MLPAAFGILVATGLWAQEIPPADRPLVRDLIVQVASALNDRDWVALEPLLDHDADIRLPQTSPLNLAGLKRSLSSAPAARFSLLPRRIRPLGESDVVADGVWARVTPDTRRIESDGAFTAVLRKQKGKFLLAMLRLYPVPPPPNEKPAAPSPIAGLSAEWVSLFDGKTSSGWLASGGGPFPPLWTIEDGCFKTLPPERPGPRFSIQTAQAYTDFEFEWEWKLAPGANSGVKYRVFVSRQFPNGAYDVASEYQLADDDGDPGAKVDPTERSGALYSLQAPSQSVVHKPGEWNQSRLIVQGRHVEHWLNGEKVVEYEIDEPFASPITLQHHVTEARFRNLRIRALPTPR